MSSELSGEGRVALITGAAAGLGRGVARRLAAAGYRLTLVDLDERGGEAVARELSDGSAGALFAAADVADPAAVEAVFETTLETWGGLDFVFNNAGVLGPAALIQEADDAAVARLFDVDLKGAFYVLKYAIRALRRTGGGAILNVASIAAERGSAYFPAYNAAKAGVVALTRAVARNAGRFNIRVNSLSPGSILGTELSRHLRRHPPTAEERAHEAMVYMRSVPVGRAATPEDVANFVLFLASPLAGHIHGANLTIDGGESLGFEGGTGRPATRDPQAVFGSRAAKETTHGAHAA